jgi:transposase
MMGTKARRFTPVNAISLDELVPADHFDRHLDRVLDLNFVRELVRECYVAGVGRPSVDPVVFFRLQLVMFFEGIRSERQLLRLAADRLSFEYRLGNCSALEWVVDQYRVYMDERSGSRSDPNRPDDPEYIVRLVKQVVTVSMETVRLVKELVATVAWDGVVAVLPSGNPGGQEAL